MNKVNKLKQILPNRSMKNKTDIIFSAVQCEINERENLNNTKFRIYKTRECE